MMGRLWRRLAYLIRQRRIEAELAEEMASHRAMAGDRAFGSALRAHEDSRAVWIAPWLDSLWQDVSYAARGLRRQPAITAVIVLVLGTVIGLHTTLVTVITGVLLRPWPGISDASTVVTIYLVGQNGRAGGFRMADYRLVVDRARSLSGIAAMTPEEVRVGDSRGDERARSTAALLVSGNFFDLLGIGVTAGRGIVPADDRDGAPAAVAVLGYDFWRSHFSGDPTVVGRTLRIDDRVFTIVGVVSRAFNGSEPAYGKSLYLPLAAGALLGSATTGPPAPSGETRERVLELVGRLAPGSARADAEAELRVLSGELARAFDAKPIGALVTGTSFASHPDRRNATQPLIAAALVSAGLLLVWLTACANIGNLQLARAAARVREIGIRLSLGASRARIVRQLLTEGFVVALGASAMGVAAAYQLPFLILRAVGNAEQSFPFVVTPDALVLAYAIVAAALSTVAFGLAPALQATRTDVSSALNLREGLPRSSSRLRNGLLAVQVALSVTLLASAGLLVRGTRQHAQSFDAGFAVDELTVVGFDLPAGAYNDARRRALVADLMQALRGLPPGAVDAFGFGTWEPTFIMRGFRMPVRRPGQSRAQARDVTSMQISVGYLDALRIPIVAGRDFAPSDVTRRVAIINETMARQYWPDEHPVGQTFFSNGAEPVEVVGVMRDAHTHSLYTVPPIFYEPLRDGRPMPTLLVRSRARTIASDLAGVVARVDPRVQPRIAPLASSLEARLKEMRIGPLLAGALGLFALVLATVGLSGVFGYAVSQRTREIGIRLALGAQPSAVVRLILGGHSRAVLVGLAIGLLGALAASAVLGNRLHGVSPLDPLTYLGVSAILTVAGLSATYLPARRAVRVDPVDALRHE
jgi:predicted permease